VPPAPPCSPPAVGAGAHTRGAGPGGFGQAAGRPVKPSCWLPQRLEHYAPRGGFALTRLALLAAVAPRPAAATAAGSCAPAATAATSARLQSAAAVHFVIIIRQRTTQCSSSAPSGVQCTTQRAVHRAFDYESTWLDVDTGLTSSDAAATGSLASCQLRAAAHPSAGTRSPSQIGRPRHCSALRPLPRPPWSWSCPAVFIALQRAAAKVRRW
jgi:hypothetical protein